MAQEGPAGGAAGGEPIDLAELELLRDITFRRRADLRLRDLRAVERFVNRVGFAFLYRVRGSELPSVWEAIVGRRSPVLPRHSHHDASVGLAWEAKDVLAARQRIFYGKVLRRSPTLMSLELFPAFYALSGNRGFDDDYLRWVRSGLLSLSARRIMEVLLSRHPLTTGDLRALTGSAGRGRRYAFDRAIAELQEKMLIVKYAELYDPKFTFLWGPLHLWLPGPIASARRIDPEAARGMILEHHLEVKWAATEKEIQRLFGWPSPEVSRALRRLREKGKILPRAIGGVPGEAHAVPGIAAALEKLRRRPPRCRKLERIGARA